MEDVKMKRRRDSLEDQFGERQMDACKKNGDGTNRITVGKANMEGGRPYFTLRVYTGVQIRKGIYGGDTG